MTARPVRRWLVCLGMMLGLVLKATPTAQQCYLDISAYASGIVSGYDASGNGVVDYFGSGFDYSWCEGYQCAHEYAIGGTLRQLPSQQVWDQIEGGGTEFSQSVGVTPGEYEVESLFYVGCWACAQQTFVTQASQVIQVPQNQGCGDERDTMINEYRPGVVYQNGVSPIPGCSDIEYHSSGYQYLTNFTWGELNWNWGQGNPHTGWGIIHAGAANGLQTTRNNYGQAIYVSSGYRCPHGNASIPGDDNSHHMRGRAIDMYKWGGNVAPYWSEAEFNALKDIADNTMPVESFPYTEYPDRHYHAAW